MDDDISEAIDSFERALCIRERTITGAAYESADIEAGTRRQVLAAEITRLRAEVERLRIPLHTISSLSIIPPFMTEQARQLMLVQGIAKQALKGASMG